MNQVWEMMALAAIRYSEFLLARCWLTSVRPLFAF